MLKSTKEPSLLSSSLLEGLPSSTSKKPKLSGLYEKCTNKVEVGFSGSSRLDDARTRHARLWEPSAETTLSQPEPAALGYRCYDGYYAVLTIRATISFFVTCVALKWVLENFECWGCVGGGGGGRRGPGVCGLQEFEIQTLRKL